MNLTKALKLKKKLITKANETKNRMVQSNSYDVDNRPAYNSEAEFAEWVKLTNQIIELKAKIHIANAPIYHLIFRLSELKSMVSNFKYMTCTNSISKRIGQEPIKMVSTISQTTKDEQIEVWETQIEEIQDEIETFNAKTQIN